MTVRSTEAERTHRCSPYCTACLPITDRIVHVERRFFESNTLTRFSEMQGRRYLFVLHGQEHLGQTSYPSSGRRMPDIRFYRTKGTKLPFTGIMRERGCQRFHFDRIS